MIHQTAGYERILKTWLSFHYYDVCLSYFTFSQEKWIRQTLLHLFVVHFNSELSGEHKWDPVLQSISLLWICSVKSLHRDTQASVSSTIARTTSKDLLECSGKIYKIFISSTSHPNPQAILKLIFLPFWEIKRVILRVTSCFSAPGANLLNTGSTVLCWIPHEGIKFLTHQGPVSGTLVELHWSV